MIKLHALKYSRATRVLWLMNDLGLPCDRVDYDRTDDFRAPDTLSNVHPLGKSPVIEDDGAMIAESATILRYIDETYGAGRHQPAPGTDQYWRHTALLDYVEASFAEVAVRVIMPVFQGKTAPEAAQAALDQHLAYIADQIGDGPFLCGDRLTLADIQISYLLALLERLDLLGDYDVIKRYWATLQKQPGYIAAVDDNGPMAPPE